MIKYKFAPDIQALAEEIARILFPYINMARVRCYRSHGSKAKGTIARCHSLGKLMQMALGVQAFYPLEFLSENFDNLDNDEKIKIIIHEMMHIPKSFGGGFRHHDYVCDRNIAKCFKLYKMKKADSFIESDFIDEKKPKKIKWF